MKMTKVLCISNRALSNLEFGKFYFLDESTVYTSLNGESYGLIFQDIDGDKRIGNIAMSHFETNPNFDSNFRIEVATNSGGYGFDNSIEELLKDVTREYDDVEANKVLEWIRTADKDAEYVSKDKRMHITFED